MQVAQLILSVLGSSATPIGGRTAIQKIVYFASIKTGVQVDYGPHFYGPYSPAVAVLLDNLVVMGFVREEAKPTTRDRTMYSYSLTDDGIELVKEVEKREANECKQVRRVVNACRNISKNNINVLSWAAKVYFLLSQKGASISYKEAMEASERLGWKLSRREINSGVKLLSGLKLAKKSRAG